MKKTITTMLLTASLIVNALFLYVRLEKKVYMAGAEKGRDVFYKKIVNEIATNKRLIVEAPGGGRYVLIPQAPPKKQPISPTLPAEPETESEKK